MASTNQRALLCAMSKSLHGEQAPTTQMLVFIFPSLIPCYSDANLCHVQRRLDVETPSYVVANAIDRFRARARLSDAAQTAEGNSVKVLVVTDVRGARYFMS